MIRRTTPSLGSIAAMTGAVLAVSLLAGCAGTGGAVREKTSKQWYDEGGRLAAAGKHEDALQAFREASKIYRGADLDADIQIALADTYFNQEEYPAAVEAYQEFLRLHPHNARADYAQFRVGLCWQKQMRGADRSPEAAHKAAAAFDALLRGYPRSGLREKAGEGLLAARRRVAEHELSVADFYRRTERFRAAAGRYEAVLKDFADLGLADRVLYELGGCYRELREEDKAAQLYEQLRREHPQSRFVRALEITEG